MFGRAGGERVLRFVGGSSTSNSGSGNNASNSERSAEHASLGLSAKAGLSATATVVTTAALAFEIFGHLFKDFGLGAEVRGSCRAQPAARPTIDLIL